MASSTIAPQQVLKHSRTMVVVGASKSPEKDAHSVPLYLKEHGHRIIPVNPTAAQIFGERAYASLLELPESLAREVDLVLIFRPSQELPGLAGQVVEMNRRYGGPLVFWSQLGIEDDGAKEILAAAGIPYVMDACARVVHASMNRQG